MKFSCFVQLIKISPSRTGKYDIFVSPNDCETNYGHIYTAKYPMLLQRYSQSGRCSSFCRPPFYCPPGIEIKFLISVAPRFQSPTPNSAIHKAQGFTASGPYLPFCTNTHAQSVKPLDVKSQCCQHCSHTPFTMHKESMGLHAPLWCMKARGFLLYPNPIGCISHMICLGNNHGVQFREIRFHFAILFELFH